MAGWLDTPLLNLLEGGLDGLGLRQKVLADNIANVDTPGFKRSDVNFDKVLQAAVDNQKNIAVSQEDATTGSVPATGMSAADFVVKDESTSIRNDGNNVDIDTEMTKLAENTLHYNALVTMLTSHLSLLKQVIKG